jgi:hypothetical protein
MVNNFFFFKNRTFNELMVELDRPQKKIRRMRFACRITKATDTHSEYVILTAFPLLERLRERISMLRLHVHCLSFSSQRI